jgi:hypothetical protein
MGIPMTIGEGTGMGIGIDIGKDPEGGQVEVEREGESEKEVRKESEKEVEVEVEDKNFNYYSDFWEKIPKTPFEASKRQSGYISRSPAVWGRSSNIKRSSIQSG